MKFFEQIKKIALSDFDLERKRLDAVDIDQLKIINFYVEKGEIKKEDVGQLCKFIVLWQKENKRIAINGELGQLINNFKKD